MSETTAPPCYLLKRTVAAFRANGIPKGQPRPRAFVRGKRAAVYDPGTAEGWKGEIALAARELENRWLAQALAVQLTFYMPRPKSHFNGKGALKPNMPGMVNVCAPDTDNLAKAVLDALTHIGVWNDDAQVCELHVRRYYTPANDPRPGVMVRISELVEMTE